MGFRRGIRRGPVCHPHEPNKNQMACAAPVAARRQAACCTLPWQNHRHALKFSSCQVAGLPRRLPWKSQATLSHSVLCIHPDDVAFHVYNVTFEILNTPGDCSNKIRLSSDGSLTWAGQGAGKTQIFYINPPDWAATREG